MRRHFQLRPERYRPVLGLEDGEVIDLNAVVDARVQRRARQPVSAKLYASRRREERDIATVFLLDLSASTDETAPDSNERIVDIVKDALVIMAVALEEIGDLYAVYGFSGQGRDGVEVYPVKTFGERLTPAVQSRIGGLEPRGSTRMGAALRHAAAKMTGVPAPSRHLVLLSDGFPQIRLRHRSRHPRMASATRRRRCARSSRPACGPSASRWTSPGTTTCARCAPRSSTW